MFKFTVYIRINGDEWGEHEVVAPNIASAAFIAGMRFQRDKNSYAGDFITCVVSPNNLSEPLIP